MSAVMTTETPAVFMNVKQVANYLHLNEKKIYAMASEGRIPATKITGKWMFPRELIDRWILDSAHGGLLVDRLAIAGSDDPLLYRVVTGFTRDLKAHAQISYTPTGTRLGLDLLQSQRIDVGGLHWGPGAESHTRHPALLRQYSQHRNWVLIRAFSREQGLMARASVLSRTRDPVDLAAARFRWVERQSGSGAQRFLMEMYNQPGAWPHSLNVTTTALSEREAATAIVMDQADVAPGSRAAANEAGLGFVSFGWESFDFALPRNIWFRRLFQELLSRLTSGEGRRLADTLGGYEMKGTGELVWAHE